MNATTRHQTLDREARARFEAVLADQRQLRLDLITEYSRTELKHRHASDADRQVSDTILQAAHSALADIDAAIARLRAGTYGSCVQCGLPLLPDWLEVLPQLSRCLACEGAVP